MAKAKQMWGSSEEHDDDILDRFLKVKRFQESQVPSYESDGIPSIIGIEDDESASEIGGRYLTDEDNVIILWSIWRYLSRKKL